MAESEGKAGSKPFIWRNNIYAVEHDDVDIKEFLDAMKLNQCATIKKYIPYSSHIHQHVVRSPKSDLYCTWELMGTPFDCESDESLQFGRTSYTG